MEIALFVIVALFANWLGACYIAQLTDWPEFGAGVFLVGIVVIIIGALIASSHSSSS